MRGDDQSDLFRGEVESEADRQGDDRLESGKDQGGLARNMGCLLGGEVRGHRITTCARAHAATSVTVRAGWNVDVGEADVADVAVGVGSDPDRDRRVAGEAET